MALNFPATPTNGQIYNDYVWNSTTETWQSIKKLTTVEVATTDPGAIVNGQLWFNETDEKLYVFYNDSWIAVGP